MKRSTEETGFVALEPPQRGRRGTDSDDRRGWLSHGLAALAVSALGLAVAGSISLTTSAAPTSSPPAASTTAGRTAASNATGIVPGVAQPSQAASVTASGPLAAFGRAVVEEAQTSSTRTAASEHAILTERAAQRSEDLSKSSEEVSRAVLDQSSQARGKSLVASDKATREQAVKLAQQRLRQAIAARVAAETARQQSESADSVQPGSPDLSAIPSGGGSSSPVPGAVIGAHFGQYGMWSRYHTGLDFRASYGTPIRAVTSGVVVYAGNSGDWAGNHVALRHAGGYTSMSSHMSSMAVRTGQSVQAGQIIGYVGQTGRAFGAHLHFEIYPAGVKYGDVYKAINPVPWLSRVGVQTR